MTYHYQVGVVLLILVLAGSGVCGVNVTSQCDRLDAKMAGMQTQLADKMADMQTQLETLRQSQLEIQQAIVMLTTSMKTLTSATLRTRNIESSPALPRDCADLMASDVMSSGQYTIYLGKLQRPVLVYCDMTTDGGGWTVLQRRVNGSENFYRSWSDYKNGFGKVTGEFWLGNDNIHFLTQGRENHLRIDLGDWYGNRRYAEYTNFKVASACEKYKLTVGAYCGDAGDSLGGHNGMKFSTLDQDNDIYGTSCAVQFRGAWWYSNCHDSNLNGLYLRGTYSSYGDGVVWSSWTGDYYSLKFTELKIKPYDL